MKLFRSKLNELIEWKNSIERKPLILWGARQVGKSYLIKELFAEVYYKNYVYIDLKKDEESLNFFKTTSDSDKYIHYIELKYKKKLDRNCLLIVDEVQLCHNVLSSLKYFYQDHKEVNIIVTGSLVRLSLFNDKNEEGLFPVGKVHSIFLYPLSFEEYLINTNKELHKLIVKSYKDKVPLENVYHKIANNILHEYLSIGGMPEVVEKFLTTKSYFDTYTVLNDIYTDYINDMSTYSVSTSMIMKTKKVYENIFVELNKENKNFKISLIDPNKSNRDYLDAYNWLEYSNIVYKSNKLDGKISIPMFLKDNLFRLYLFDVGLFSYQSKVDRSDFFVENKRNTLSGIFYENYIACELKSNDIPLFYWKGKNDFEFEFVVQSENVIIPIDVKKNKGRLNSLENFRTYNPINLAIKIGNYNYGYDNTNKILTIPLYMGFMLIKDIKNRTLIKNICNK